MFVTISALLDEADVVEETVHIHNAAVTRLSCQDYLSARQDILTLYTYTPVRVAVMQRGSPLVHIVEFTGHHYGIMRPMDNDTVYWWFNAHSATLLSGQPDTQQREYTLPAQEPLLHTYARSLANDYFNDRFHLVDVKPE